MADSDQEQPIKIPIRDKRKLTQADLGEEGARVSEVTLADFAEPAEDGELAAARREAASHLDDLRRLKAEFDNYRKRTLKEQSRLIEMAAMGTVAQLLGVLDHFDLALAAAGQTQDYDKMLKGVEMVHGELLEVLKGAGLELIDAAGQPFDPNLHEAAFEEEGDGSGVMVVGQVLRNGYRFKDVVLRPAMVQVTQDGSAGSAASEASEEEGDG